MKKITTFLLMFMASISLLMAQPTAAPADPTSSAIDVISVFSDTYTDVAGTDFNPGWGQATVVTTEDLSGNSVLKYAGLNYQGTQIGSAVDASTLDYLHIDMYTEDATAVSVYCISLTTGEQAYAMTITLDSWQSYDIPLTAFTDLGLSMADIHQFKFVGDGDVYLDNIYFYATAPAAGTDDRLTDIEVGGTSIDGFNANALSYTYEVPVGTTIVPTVTVMKSDDAADAVITPAAAIPGTTNIVVTSDDGSESKTYTVEFKFELDLPITFETGTVAVDFGDFNGAVTTVEDNTVTGGINTSAKVMQMTKNGSWSGTSFSLSNTLDFSVNKGISIDVLTATAGESILLKLEGTEGPVELAIPSTVAGEWETIIFDFSDATTDAYNKMVFFLDGAVNATATLLVDNIQQVEIIKSSINTLSDLRVNTSTVAGFNEATENYDVALAIGTIAIPVVEADVTDATATAVITQATSTSGQASVEVTAEDLSVKTYTIDFSVIPNTDATLSELKIGGKSISDFKADSLDYTYELPFGTTVVPPLTGVSTDVNATTVPTDATQLPGTSSVTVTAEDGLANIIYTVDFTVATEISDDATLSEILVDDVAIEDFKADSMDYVVILPFGSDVVPEVIGVTNNLAATMVYTDASALTDTVTITVTAQDGVALGVYKVSFLVTENTVVADFDADVKVGEGPLSVQFENKSVDATNYIWYFGDGESSTDENPLHIYTAVGTYMVSLVAIDSIFSDSIAKEGFITVQEVGTAIEQSFSESFELYPNPASGQFMISFNGNEKANLRVYSLLGELVIDQQNLSNKTTITTDHLSKGIYVVRLVVGNNVQSQRIVIE